MANDLPLLVVAATVSTYWGTVLALVAYKRLRHGQSAGLVPRTRYERRLWRLVLPVVGSWIALPIVACTGGGWLFGLPAWAAETPVVQAGRGVAAGVAVVCYALSLYCWLLMGRNWSMAVVPKQQSQLVTTGLYRWVRHPIYALSIALMLATAVTLPNAPMLLVAALHLVVMNLKARNEERHLTTTFGPSYTEYCGKVGRFWPRWTQRAA